MVIDIATDKVRQLVRAKLAEHRLTMSEVSKAIGKNHAYLHQFLDRGIPGSFPELVRERLAPILKVPEEMLKSDGTVRSKSSSAGVFSGMFFPNDKMPIHGSAQGGSDGFFPWNGQTSEFVSRPAYLSGVALAYALYVSGSSMEPRYLAGEHVHVHPGKPVTNGNFVVVQIKPDSEGDPPKAFIKRLVRRTATKVIFEQFNPPKEFDIKASDIISIHKIVGSAESSGF
jgi:phage repressor protein C with HTH and peptisase S24 domain